MSGTARFRRKEPPRDLLVRDLSEEELLGWIVPLLPKAPGTVVGPGDDAAVVKAPDGRYVVTCDVLVEGRHFRREWSPAFDVGRKAAIQNLADVAAMGARPTVLIVGLAMPSDLPVRWVVEFCRGLAYVCKDLEVGVVGGDLSSADQIFISVTAHGDLEGRKPVRRRGARPGDVLAYAGILGYSAAGLAALEAGDRLDWNNSRTGGRFVPFLGAYQVPRWPPFAGVRAAEAGVTAMLDVSDGLLRDAGRLAQASNVCIDLDNAAIDAAARQLRPAILELGLQPDDARNWVLAGGEDHGLLATFPPDVELPLPFQRIGTVQAVDVDFKPTVRVGGKKPNITPGWDHFKRD